MHKLYTLLLASFGVVLLASLIHSALSSQTDISEEAKHYIAQRGHPNGIEFGFMLLSSESDKQIAELVKQVKTAIAPLTAHQGLIEKYGPYVNVGVRIPHVSIGQYGIDPAELDKVKEMAKTIAASFSPITEEMKGEFSVTAENVFYDAKNIRANTNPIIRDLYRALRKPYMELPTRFMIAQAIMEMEQNKSDLAEVDHIQQCFQNWGTPEGDRIRPHYTLVYNHVAEVEDIEKGIAEIQVPASLRTITFDKIGIVRIDFWGNPTELLYEIPLGKAGN